MKIRNQPITGKSSTSGNDEPESWKVQIRKIPTGISGLDEILGGGIPEFSCNIIAGKPGCGKTTLAHQIVFANATPKKTALYFTVLGESTIKMLRYQQHFSFFDVSKVGTAIRIVNLAETALKRDLNAVFDEIKKQVTAVNPSIVVVDSFRSVIPKVTGGVSDMETQLFIYRLSQFLSCWEATTFLVGEYFEDETKDNPLFTLADGLLWLSQIVERNSVMRKLQVVKLRGAECVPGLHTIRITNDGIQAFSRTLGLLGNKPKEERSRRISIGVSDLDKMLGGGVFQGDSILIAGPSGTGKTAIATQFIAEGLRSGDSAIMAIFEENLQRYVFRAKGFGIEFKPSIEEGKLKILYLRPLDLSVDETMQELLDAIVHINAKRLVIDSLTGFEMALAPGFREDFRESLYRMIGALIGAGVTILSTVEVEDTFNAFPFSHYAISCLTDEIIRMRYVEINGQMRKTLVIMKMRGSNHSKDIREYVITDKGLVIVSPGSTDYSRMSTGLPEISARKAEVSPEAKAPSESN